MKRRDKATHFIKIILSDTHSHSKIMVPRKFISKHGKNLHASVSLKAPNGLAWPVNLVTRKGDVWLQNGWPEFGRFYSIKFGYLLVFEYRGHGDFQVRIFDPSCTEIDYPLFTSADFNFVESTQREKRIRDIEDSGNCYDVVKLRKRRRKPKLQQERANACRDFASQVEKDKALACAQAFKSENSFFILSVKPYHLNGRGRPCMPKSFKEAYENWKHNDQIILQVAGRTSPVYCTLKLDVHRYRISPGWSAFARENSLNVGDACVFELIVPSTKLFQVSIFRASVKSEKT